MRSALLSMGICNNLVSASLASLAAAASMHGSMLLHAAILGSVAHSQLLRNTTDEVLPSALCQSAARDRVGTQKSHQAVLWQRNSSLPGGTLTGL